MNGIAAYGDVGNDHPLSAAVLGGQDHQTADRMVWVALLFLSVIAIVLGLGVALAELQSESDYEARR